MGMTKKLLKCPKSKNSIWYDSLEDNPELYRTTKLYKIEDGDVSVVSEAPLKQEMLESDVRK